MRASVSVAVALAGFVLSAGIVAAQVKPNTAGLETREIEVTARSIPTFARGDGPRISDRLAWRGGLELSSSASEFGGWSGLAMDRDSKSFVAVSDSGIWMTGKVAYDGDRPQALTEVRIGALRTQKGGSLGRQRDRDAESIALASGTVGKGTAYIGFEQNSRIGLFALGKNGLGAPSSYAVMPPEARRMYNAGFEAVTVLAGGARKGALVAFAEEPPSGAKQHRGWIWVGGKPQPFTVPGVEGFGITDAASLDDGSVLIVERRFRWLEGLRVRLRLLDAAGLAPGGVASGTVLLEASNANAEIDNLEAISVSKDGAGETVVTLMSDDNFNRFLQRTVFLQFTLKDEAKAPRSAAVEK